MDSHDNPDSSGPEHDLPPFEVFRPARPSSRFPGWEYLSGSPTTEILGRLLHEDPLDLYDLAEARLEQRSLLLDAQRLGLRAMARTAHRARDYRECDALHGWLLERIDEAVADLLAEDAQQDDRGVPCREPWDARYSFLAESIRSTSRVARRVCVRFNALPEDTRRAFYAVRVLGKTVRRHVAEGHGPPERVREHLRAAAAAFRDVHVADGIRGFWEGEDG